MLRTGTFATHTVVPEVAAVKIPAELPAEQACLIGCAVATGVMSVLETAKVWEGARVAVIGCGAVGLSVIQGARIAGASQIRAIDLDEHKLEQAKRFGATDVGEGPVDFAFDVVGRRSTFELGLSLLASGGTLTLIGLSPAGETAPSGSQVSSRSEHASSSPTAGTICPPRTSRGSRSGRSTEVSISPAWSPASRRSATGETRSTHSARATSCGPS